MVKKNTIFLQQNNPPIFVAGEVAPYGPWTIVASMPCNWLPWIYGHDSAVYAVWVVSDYQGINLRRNTVPWLPLWFGLWVVGIGCFLFEVLTWLNLTLRIWVSARKCCPLFFLSFFLAWTTSQDASELRGQESSIPPRKDEWLQWQRGFWAMMMPICWWIIVSANLGWLITV